jgi:dTDP-glucose 4,6-dehydratase
MRVLVTGGAGFIGCNFLRFLLKQNSGIEIVVLDKLTYAGRLENLQDLMEQIKFIKGDICNREDVENSIKGCEAVINFAAETHVDRSIIDAGDFVKTDVLGTYTLLEASRKHDIDRFVQISTDEVYGSILRGSFKESDALDPSSPYSASKAGGDLIVNAYFKTYGLPVITTRSSNNYGPFQFPEKLIPVLILNALRNKELPLYAKGENVRDWIHVDDNCRAIHLAFEKGKPGEIYNIGSDNEHRNIDIARLILKELTKPENLIKFVEDRPGHDLRYSLDSSKIRTLGWISSVNFDEGLKQTIHWYKENEWWWKPLV